MNADSMKRGDFLKENPICKFSELRSSDLVCTDFVYETTDVQKTDTILSRYMLGFVAKGGVSLNVGASTYSMTAGELFLIRKNTSFRIVMEEESSYFYVCFQGRRAEELTERLGLDASVAVVDRREELERLVSFGFECMEKMDEGNTDLLGEAMLLYLMGHLSPRRRKEQNLLSEMVSITNEHFTELSFSLPTLAQMLGYDAKYLSHYFKKSKGIGFSQYLRELRIDRAVFLIEQGVVCVKNIALLSGFFDALYFSKVFKSIKGMPPKQYIDGLQK